LADFTFVICSEQEEITEAIRERLEATGHVTVVGTVSDPEALPGEVERLGPDGIFADLGLAPHVVLDALEAVSAPRPKVLVSGPQDDPHLILRAMKQGVREFVSPELDPEEVISAVARTVLDQSGPAPERPPGRVVAVMGAKGGVGATFVATQLGASLQRRGGRAVVVDLNYPLGDVALHFDLHPQYTLADVARQGQELDENYLHNVLQRHASGVAVLAAPKRVEEAELLTRERVDQALGLLREDYDWVIVDASRSWNEPSAQAFERADQILLVGSLDVPTLNHVKQQIELFKRLGYLDSNIRAVVNRYSRTDPVTERDFREFVGREPDVRLPNDFATAASCLNQGRTLGEIAAGSALHQAVEELARCTQRWCGIETEETQPNETLTRRLRRILGR
jgi:pilus assembly protein CpaE